MTIMRPLHLWLFCLLILAIHWMNQYIGTYGLMFDEAQYWFWGKHPAWGYYSKPPVIAWLIGASTAIFGDGNFGAKMLSPILAVATGGMLYATALRMKYTERTAAWVLVTYITLPVVTGNSMFFTTDVPLRFFWAVAMYGIISAWNTKQARYWVLAGIAAGLGLLSKYTMVAFAASALLAMLSSRDLRPQLAKPWPWLAAAVALLVLVPNLLWNTHHHFVTFTHTNDNVFSKSVQIYPEDMLGFMGAQFGMFGPILLIALIQGLLEIRQKRDERACLMHWFVWPLACIGGVVSLLAGAQAHWISPVYLAGTLIVVPWLLDRRPVWLQVSLGLHLVVLVLFYLAPTFIPYLSLKKDPLARAFVWNQLAGEVRPFIEKYPDAVIMTNERKIAAAFTYQLRDIRGWKEPVYKWRAPKTNVHDHYDLLSQEKDFSRSQRLVIMRYAYFDNPKPTSRARLLKRITLQKYQFAVYLVLPDKH